MKIIEYDPLEDEDSDEYDEEIDKNDITESEIKDQCQILYQAFRS